MNTPALPLITVLAVGWGCRRLPGLPSPAETRRVLNTVVISVFLPALMFRVMRSTAPDGAFVIVPVAAASAMVLSFAVALGIYGLLQRFSGRRLAAPTLGALVFCAAFSNITFLGLPLLTAYFGPSMQKIVLLCDPFCLGPLVYAVGPVLGQWFGNDRSAARRRWEPLRAVLRLPPFWAVGLGLIFQLGALPVPNVLDQALILMSQAVIPLIVFSVGLALELPPTAREWRGLGALMPAMGVKLFVTPALTWALLQLLTRSAPSALSSAEQQAVVLEGAMPTMVVTCMVAEAVGLDHKAAARMVALTTLLSIVTVPWWRGIL